MVIKDIKQVKNGWEFDSILFKTKEAAIKVRDRSANVKNSTAKLDLKNAEIIYDGTSNASFGRFVENFLEINPAGSISKLAKNLEVSRETFYCWMRGDKMPSKENIKSISKAFKLSKEGVFVVLQSNLLNANANLFDLKVEEVKNLITKNG